MVLGPIYFLIHFNINFLYFSPIDLFLINFTNKLSLKALTFQLQGMKLTANHFTKR